MINWDEQPTRPTHYKRAELKFKKKKNDYVLWFLTALAVTAVINAVIEVINTW